MTRTAPNPSRVPALVGALAIGVLLTSCGPAGSGGSAADVPDDWTEHTVGDVTFSAPAAWEVEGSGGSVVVRRGTDADDAMASVALVPEPRPLKSESDAVFASMVAAIGATMVDDGPVEKAGATEALQLEYTGDQPRADGSGTFPARSRWMFMKLEDGTGVIAAVTAPEDQFDDELETVLESVTLP